MELETFPTTSGSQALLAHPMFGAGRGQSPQAPVVTDGAGDLSRVVASFFASDASKERADYVCPTFDGNELIIQRAIDELTNTGTVNFDADQPGRIMLTEGSFYLDGTVTTRGCEIEGVNSYFAGTNIYSNEEFAGPLFLADTDRGGRFAHLHINGGWEENILVTGSGVWIEKCVIASAIGPGIRVNGAVDVWVSDCHINASSGGVVVQDSTQVRIDGCTFQFGSDSGIVKIAGDCQYVWLTDCYLDGQTDPVEDDIVVSSGASNIIVRGNVAVQEVDLVASESVVSGNVFGGGTLSLTTSVDGPNIINGVVVP